MITAEEIQNNFGLHELTPEDAYTWVFHLNEEDSKYIENKWEDEGEFHANPVAYYRFQNRKEGGFRILFKDTILEELKMLQRADFAILNGLTYFGRKNLSEHSSKMFAMIFDWDGVSINRLTDFFLNCADNGNIPAFYPLPNIIACSGHGLHLYYLFEKPIDLYPNTKAYLKALKYALTEIIWNKYTSEIEKPQLQGINQGFRVIGGKTKIEGTFVRAFKVRSERWTLKDLASYVSEGAVKISPDNVYKESRYTLEEARKRYPEWYASLGEKKEKGHWTVKRDLYDWWKRKIQTEKEAKLGHRYFCMMALAIYAVKCGISLEELKKDALELVPVLDLLSTDDSNRFTENDVLSALECYDLRYVRFPRYDIEKICDIRIDPNKRNSRPQAVHVKIMNSTRDILYPNGEWRGRKSKEAEVLRWKAENPKGSKAQCHRETRLSRTTIDKYWKTATIEKQEQK